MGMSRKCFVEVCRFITSLYAVNGMYVFHTIENYSSNLLERLVRTHHTHCASLHEHITTRQQFNGLLSLSFIPVTSDKKTNSP